MKIKDYMLYTISIILLVAFSIIAFIEYINTNFSLAYVGFFDLPLSVATLFLIKDLSYNMKFIYRIISCICLTLNLAIATLFLILPDLGPFIYTTFLYVFALLTMHIIVCLKTDIKVNEYIYEITLVLSMVISIIVLLNNDKDYMHHLLIMMPSGILEFIALFMCYKTSKINKIHRNINYAILIIYSVLMIILTLVSAKDLFYNYIFSILMITLSIFMFVIIAMKDNNKNNIENNIAIE